MLDKDTALEGVRFVMDALSDPESAIDREGDLHTALAPHLRNWVASSPDGLRTTLMVSAVGSVNYGTVVETSDLDMKAVYLPNLRDFYGNSFPKFSFTTDRFDCELHPAHTFAKHVLKGNINFFEFLYSKACLATPDFIYIMKVILTPMVEMNAKMTALASYFTAEQSNKGTGYVNPDEPWGHKKASQAIRILAFLIHLLDTGKFDIVTAEPFRTAVVRLKRDEMPWAEYVQLYDELHDTAKGMMFRHFNNGGDFEWTDAVQDMDGTGTNHWNDLRGQLDDALIRMVREPIELAHRD